MSIDLVSADCIFEARKRARSEEVAAYFAQVARYYEQKGYLKLVIFLDRNTTHKSKMQDLFHKQTADLKIKTQFHLMAAYSPKLNLVEYAIHLIRQKVLHQADCKTDLATFEKRIKELCSDKNFLTQEKIINILVHIENTILDL